MQGDYWYMNLAVDGQMNLNGAIKIFQRDGWEFVPNGGRDRAEVMIFKKRVMPMMNPDKKGISVHPKGDFI